MTVKKLYCYVDENGQDTQGKIFVVSVIVTEENRDELLILCEELEKISQKGKDKWRTAKHERRMRYMRHIIADGRFKGSLRYEVFKNTKDYDTSTITGIVSAVKWDKPTLPYTAMVYIDGLSKTKRFEYGARLRHMGLPVRRIKAIRKDEADALIRLADSVAGFVRDAIDDKSVEITEVFKKARKDGVIIEV